MLVQCVGECMVEFSRGADGAAAIGYAGDAYNTAVYFRRAATSLALDAEVRFLTGVGDDLESRRLVEAWDEAGIAYDVQVVSDRAPGAYLIDTDELGERSFTYWRAHSAAATMFAGTEWVDLLRGRVIYLSGITVQLLSENSRRAVVDRLAELRRGGAVVAFDSNYRPSGWPSAEAAGAAMAEVLRVTDIALLTLEDELALGTCVDVESCADWAASLGVAEVVVKVGEDGAWIRSAAGLRHVPTTPVEAVDSTAAGDSFNGTYLAARLAGHDPIAACGFGNHVAGQVVQHRGAIVEIA